VIHFFIARSVRTFLAERGACTFWQVCHRALSLRDVCGFLIFLPALLGASVMP